MEKYTPMMMQYLKIKNKATSETLHLLYNCNYVK